LRAPLRALVVQMFTDSVHGVPADGALALCAQKSPAVQHPSLDKTEYVKLRAALRLTPSVLPTIGILAFDVALLTAAAALLRASSWESFALAQLLLVVVFFNAFSIMHECGHGSASASPRLNAALGHIASSLCFIPFYSWRYIHQKHHAYTGNVERDPVLKSLRRWRASGVPAIVRASWQAWIPLGALLQHAVYLMYPLELRRSGELTRRKAVRCLISTLWLPLSWALGGWLAPDLVRFESVAPALILFLVAEELVNIPHHVGATTFDRKLAVWEQYRASRSCWYPTGVSELLLLNFNFHIEHHLFPTLPWFRLRGARTAVKQLLAERYEEAIGIQWNLENRSRDLENIVRDTRRA
jgi:fatty acid desaturase